MYQCCFAKKTAKLLDALKDNDENNNVCSLKIRNYPHTSKLN